MIRYSFRIATVILFISVITAACSGNRKEKNKPSDEEPVTEVKPSAVIGNETSLLLKDLEENGDYVNSQVFPSLIKASIVHENLGKNILLV
jgi:hypothetical protein